MFNLSLFVERLKELFSEREITQKQLAQATGLTETSIGNYLNGENIPSLTSLIALADYFKCSTDFLIGYVEYSDEKTFLPCPPFSERLNFILKDKQCTGYNLCKQANIPEASFYDWKNGKTLPTLDNLDKIKTYFGFSLDYLLGREC